MRLQNMQQISVLGLNGDCPVATAMAEYAQERDMFNHDAHQNEPRPWYGNKKPRDARVLGELSILGHVPRLWKQTFKNSRVDPVILARSMPVRKLAGVRLQQENIAQSRVVHLQYPEYPPNLKCRCFFPGKSYHQ